MAETLSLVASLITIVVQGQLLVEQHQEKTAVQDFEQQQQESEMQQRRREILEAAVTRKQIILSQTHLGE